MAQKRQKLPTTERNRTGQSGGDKKSLFSGAQKKRPHPGFSLSFLFIDHFPAQNQVHSLSPPSSRPHRLDSFTFSPETNQNTPF